MSVHDADLLTTIARLIERVLELEGQPLSFDRLSELTVGLPATTQAMLCLIFLSGEVQSVGWWHIGHASEARRVDPEAC